ncbi:uncharacterized protein [Chiloscyllium punctatum]|uniref:uncharacterized protein isoform X2 n=1 Tax=Chiloscyllium punctatum TaxID=137246 RepID=UPI003B63961F
MAVRAGLVALLVFAVLTGTTGGPLHAQCSVEWTFGIPCNSVYLELVTQIKAWRTADNCAQGGEKCLYTDVARIYCLFLVTLEKVMSLLKPLLFTCCRLTHNTLREEFQDFDPATVKERRYIVSALERKLQMVV